MRVFRFTGPGLTRGFRPAASASRYCCFRSPRRPYEYDVGWVVTANERGCAVLDPAVSSG